MRMSVFYYCQMLTRKETDSDGSFYLRDYLELYFVIFFCFLFLNIGPIWALCCIYKQEQFWKLSLVFLFRQV